VGIFLPPTQEFRPKAPVAGGRRVASRPRRLRTAAL